MHISIDLNKHERRIASVVRRREVAHERLVKDLEIKRTTYRREFEAKRAKVLRRGDEDHRLIVADAVDEHVANELSTLRGARTCTALVGNDVATSATVLSSNLGLPEPATIVARYRMLDGLRRHSVTSTRRCGKVRIASTVQIESDGTSVSVTGVHRCHNIHGCPVCAAPLYARRAFELDSMVDQWCGYGPIRRGPHDARVAMITLTVRHGIGHSLSDVLHGVADCWRAMWCGRSGQRLRRKLRLRHFARAIELTHGPNGWHPHLHILALYDGSEWSEQDQGLLLDRWQKVVSKVLGQQHEPDVDHGVKVSAINPENRGDYLAKMGLELVGFSSKAAKGKNRTYWQVGADAAKGDRYSVALWRDAQAALFGSRQLTWSRGTRDFFDLPDLKEGEEETDLALPDALDKPSFRFDVDAVRWDAAARSDPFFLSRLVGAALDAALSGDAISVLPLLSPVWSRASHGAIRSRSSPVNVGNSELTSLELVTVGSPARVGADSIVASPT